jgi:galactokinase
MTISENFIEAYGAEATVLSSAPGRLEILGNHTDYNEGLTLSAAVEQTTEFALCPIEGRICTMRDFRDGSIIEFNLDEIDKPTPRDWTNYVKGVIVELRKRGIEVPAFQGAILSTVPLSAGMSSSAALEVAASFAFAEAFNIDLPKPEWAKIGQAVENSYLGVNTGLLDQFSSIYGKANSLIFSDFRTNEVIKNVSLPEGYLIVVANSMHKHDLVSSDYNVRRESCENVAAVMGKNNSGIKALRDVSMEQLEAAKSSLDIHDYRRALHVVGENERVIKGIELLEAGEVDAFGQLLFASHKSSRDNFENSCPELDFLVEQAKSIPGCLGARLSGGGFGGISIHLVKVEEADTYCERIAAAFKLQTGIETEIIQCAIGDGATVKAL